MIRKYHVHKSFKNFSRGCILLKIITATYEYPSCFSAQNTDISPHHHNYFIHFSQSLILV